MDNTKIKVLIVEDSALLRQELLNILKTDNRFEVIAQATNGEEAVKYAKLYSPDIISMDMFMPVMDGLEATYEIMRTNPIPIVIVNSLYKETEVHMAMQELNAGAVAILQKPFAPNHPYYETSANKYKNMLKLMSEIKVIKRTNSIKTSYSKTSNNTVIDSITSTNNKLKPKNSCVVPEIISIIAIGASAGGPEAVRIILEFLAYPIKVPVIIIQHMDANFTEGYATWLQQYSKSNVKIAKSGEKLESDTIYIAPGGSHLTIINQSTIRLIAATKNTNGPGHTPSIDVLFESIANQNPNECIAVLLSGMGKDGANGLKKLKDSGAYTLIQNETTSLIFGMPGVAEKLNAECKKLGPQEIALEINHLLNK